MRDCGHSLSWPRNPSFYRRHVGNLPYCSGKCIGRYIRRSNSDQQDGRRGESSYFWLSGRDLEHPDAIECADAEVGRNVYGGNHGQRFCHGIKFYFEWLRTVASNRQLRNLDCTRYKPVRDWLWRERTLAVRTERILNLQ